MNNPLPASLDVKEHNGPGEDPHLLGKHVGFAVVTTRYADLAPTYLARSRRLAHADPPYTADAARIGNGQSTVGNGPDPYLGGGMKVA